MKIVTIIGARPQFIKAAIVSVALKNEGIEEVILHTGQHYDDKMSEIFFRELDMVPPSYNLEVNGGTHGQMTGSMLQGIEEILMKETPDWVLIYGDTNSTLAGVLAAAKLHIPVAHVEAGLRSFNRKMPEEINRIVADQLSEVLFAPTQTAVDNLQSEGTSADKVVLSGDVMLDAALYYKERSLDRPILETVGVQSNNYCLCTIHRAENTDFPHRLDHIFAALQQLSEICPIVLSLHPRTKKYMESYGIDSGNIIMIEPVGFLDMIILESKAKLIVTDSGGVQKEAFFHKVPCITLRDETEWVELVDNGWNLLMSPEQSIDLVKVASDMNAHFTRKNIEPYGKGNAANLIAKALKGKN